MPQNKNFIAARLPQELYDRLEAHAGDKKGEKTKIIIQAIAAYLDFPLESANTTVENDEKVTSLEKRITELEQQFNELKLFVINGNQTDNIIQTNSATDNNDNNKSAVPIQDDGSIGPAPELKIAEFLGISRNSLGYHRKNMKKTGKPINQPKPIKYNNKPYNLICQGESKSRGKTIFLWIAQPVIGIDNSRYQSDIIQFQIDNVLINTPLNYSQQEEKQILELVDNSSYQKLSIQPNATEKLREKQQDLEEESTLNSQPQLAEEEQPDF